MSDSIAKKINNMNDLYPTYDGGYIGPTNYLKELNNTFNDLNHNENLALWQVEYFFNENVIINVVAKSIKDVIEVCSLNNIDYNSIITIRKILGSKVLC